MVPFSTSLLVEPSNLKAKAVQLDPVTGTHDGSPGGRPWTANLAVGGVLVIVSVASTPEDTLGSMIEEESVIMTFVIVKC